MHFLVIDPNVAFATLLTEELRRLEHTVDVCATGEAALEAMRARQPDLAFLDMALESPDALTLARQLRAQDATLRLILIPLLGENLRPEAQAISFQGVLPKPFFLPELPERIAAALAMPVQESATVPFQGNGAQDAPTGESSAPPEEMDPTEFAPAEAGIDILAGFDFGAAEEALANGEGGDLFGDSDQLLAAAVEAEAAAEEAEAAEVAEPAPTPAPVAAAGGGRADREDAGTGTPGLSYERFLRQREQVESLMSNLAMEMGADGVILTYGGGLLTWVGDLQRAEAESISRAVIHGWRTSAEVARILGREQLRFEQSIAGGSYMLYALSVAVNGILAVAVRGSAPLGLLRHHARMTASDIADLCAS